MAILVTPIDNNLTNCFIPVCIENVLSEYLNYKGYEYNYAFAYALDFQFDEMKCYTDRVADGLNIRYCFTDWLEKLYGIRVQEIPFASVSKLIDYISDRISDEEPVILHMDSYYLPWSTLYKQEHTGHMVVAVEVERVTNSIKIIDTIEKEYYYIIKKDILKNACEYVWKVCLPDKPEVVNTYQFDMRIRDGEIELIPQTRIEQLKAFTKVFALIFNPDIEFRNKYDLDLMRSEKLVDDIRKNILQINLFCNWLIWRDNEGFQPVIDIYFQVMSKWNVLVNLLYKNCLLRWQNSFHTMACDILEQIIQLEEKAREKFKISIGNKSKIADKIQMVADVKKYYRILLYDKYNNKGFCLIGQQRILEDLTGVGEYFVIEKKVIQDKDIFQYNCDGKYDNIVCEGQEILNVYDVEISEVHLLACAEWGAIDERICIIGNEEKQNIRIHIQDLSQVNEGIPYFCGRTYDTQGNVVQDRAAVFWYKVTCNQIRIKKIVLPICPNLHILAINLIESI